MQKMTLNLELKPLRNEGQLSLGSVDDSDKELYSHDRGFGVGVCRKDGRGHLPYYRPKGGGEERRPSLVMPT